MPQHPPSSAQEKSSEGLFPMVGSVELRSQNLLLLIYFEGQPVV